MLDLSKIPQEYVDDVREFIAENQRFPNICERAVEELSPGQFFTYWLNWRGLVGYSSSIVELMEALGWLPTWKR